MLHSFGPGHHANAEGIVRRDQARVRRLQASGVDGAQADEATDVIHRAGGRDRLVEIDVALAERKAKQLVHWNARNKKNVSRCCQRRGGAQQ